MLEDFDDASTLAYFAVGYSSLGVVQRNFEIGVLVVWHPVLHFAFLLPNQDVMDQWEA